MKQPDLFRGERIDLKQLAKEEEVHYSTVWRWALKGISGVRLPARRLGNKRWTTRKAIVWWSEQITARADGALSAPASLSPFRQQRLEAAERECTRRMGA